MSPVGAKATSRSAKTDTSACTRKRTPPARSTSKSSSTPSSSAASICRSSSASPTSSNTASARLHTAFQTAINDHKYQGKYCCVYPIKVNQQRQVVEEVLEFGRPYQFGLEAGSKPELMAVMAMADNETPIICNGFKDDEYIEMAMLAQKVGRQIIPVVEKYTELDLILKYSRRASAFARKSASA